MDGEQVTAILNLPKIAARLIKVELLPQHAGPCRLRKVPIPCAVTSAL
jgi:hypothetical protein